MGMMLQAVCLFLSGHDCVSYMPFTLPNGFNWACHYRLSELQYKVPASPIDLCAKRSPHLVCVCPVNPFCVNVFAEVHKLPLCSFPFSVPPICVRRADMDEKIRELEWGNESVRQRDWWRRERENEMGAKGNEIEEHFLHLTKPPKKATKNTRERCLRSVVKDKTSFFLVCLIWGGLWEVKGAQVAVQFLRLCCLDAVWRLWPDEPWKTWHRRCHFRRVTLHDCQEEKWKEK